MDTLFVAAALLSAVLHAGWNAAVKASPDPQAAMTAQMAVAAAIVVPGLALTGLPASASWPWIAASTALNLVTVIALLRSYDLIGFGVAYPVARAIAVLLIVPLAALLTGETLSSYGLAGIAMMIAALALLAFANAGDGASPRAAAAWIALSGISTAAYVLCDAQGVRRSGSALAYGCAVSITNALLMAWWQNALSEPRSKIAANLKRAMPIAIASTASYLLILWVFAHAAIAPAAALRDTSAVFAVLIAVIWLRERITIWRLMAVLLAAAAVPLLRLA